MIKNSFILVLCFLTFTLFYSCKEEITNNPIGNIPPDTGLFLYPDNEVSKQPSRLTLSWWGDDPDGLIIGYYYSWDGVNWTFTDKNSINFSLQIGAADTNYTFRVSAVDNGGNGIYDNQILQNGINYGPEPFIDSNNNGKYDVGEKFIDIGLIDPTPAELKIPIKNSAPTISWNTLSSLPQTSFPAMSFGWNTDDIDGVNTISKINIVLNDTTKNENIISLDGSVRTITIRTKDFTSANPLMDILIEGIESNIFSQKLPGIKLDNYNSIFVQAEDISGAKSPFIKLPEEGKTWFVKKPKGNFLIVDDYITNDGANTFYDLMMDSLGLSNRFDVLDISQQKLPYTNVTFLTTLKLFKYVFWYSDNTPSLDLAAAVVQKYIDGGGKIAFSMQMPQVVDPVLLQGFLPINSDSIYSRTSLLANTLISAETTNPVYPKLTLSSSVFRVKSFYLNPGGAIPIYYFPNGELRGYVGFFNNTKSLFFYGLPLSKSNGGNANVKNLMSKIFFEDFGVTR